MTENLYMCKDGILFSVLGHIANQKYKSNVYIYKY